MLEINCRYIQMETVSIVQIGDIFVPLVRFPNAKWDETFESAMGILLTQVVYPQYAYCGIMSSSMKAAYNEADILQAVKAAVAEANARRTKRRRVEAPEAIPPVSEWEVRVYPYNPFRRFVK